MTSHRRLEALCLGAVIVAALALWAPRLSGPIDLRHDAGVYYILGTSLATGQGYRLLNEPGAPTGVQYPPLLPALVAVHQLALGSSDPAVVAPWLRRTYVLMFLAYAVACFALARRYSGPVLALAATALAVLHLQTYFLSDLLFAEVPFALIGVGFLLLAGSRGASERTREVGCGLLGAAAFLLRAAGVALLAAWVVEALLHRRWRLAGLRACVAAVPFVLWQAHVAGVRASDEYARPAYEYQRAPYQYYNVTYSENVGLVDPFQPELGRVDPLTVVARTAENVASMPRVLGEAVSAPFGFWQWAFHRAQDWTLRRRVLTAECLSIGVVSVLGLIVIGGLAVLVRRGDRLLVPYAVFMCGLVCLTPWPGQFARYVAPIAPLLAIAFVTALAGLRDVLAARGRPRLGTALLASVLTGILLLQLYTVTRTYLVWRRDGEAYGARGRFFYYTAGWRRFERAVDWLRTEAPRGSVVATTAPHLCWLLSGLPSIMPPLEADAARARALLDEVPVTYVIVDEIEHPDLSRRYAAPVVRADREGWRVVYAHEKTRVYARSSAAPAKK